MHEVPASIQPVPLPTTTAAELCWALGWFALLAWAFWRFGPRQGHRLFSPSANSTPPLLHRQSLLLLFALKAVGATAHGLIYYHFYQTGDAVHHFQDARKLWTLMPENPLGYLRLLLGYSADGQAPEALRPVYDTLRGSWRTTEYFAVRLHGLFNLLTGAHYYANLILFNALLVLGLQGLFQAFARTWSQAARSLLLPLCLLPSTLFWCSALHKDAIALLALGLVLHALVPPLPMLPARNKRHTGSTTSRGASIELLAPSRYRWRALRVLLALFLLSQTRPYLVWMLLPNLVLLAWLLRNAQRPNPSVWRRHPALSYGLVNACAVFLMAMLGKLDPRFDLLQRMAFETAFLLELKGNALLDMPPSAEHLPELLANLPRALWRVLWGPIAHGQTHVFQYINALVSAGQLLTLVLLLGLGLKRRWKSPGPGVDRRPDTNSDSNSMAKSDIKSIMASDVTLDLKSGSGADRMAPQRNALLGFSLFFGLGVFLLIGLTVPQLGAIVRYKSAVLPLLFAASWVWASLPGKGNAEAF